MNTDYAGIRPFFRSLSRRSQCSWQQESVIMTFHKHIMLMSDGNRSNMITDMSVFMGILSVFLGTMSLTTRE